MALSGIPIDPQQCIGDSLAVLNSSFIELDSRTVTLSTGVGNVPVGSDLYSLVQNISSNLSTSINTVSSIALSGGVTQIIAGPNITISQGTGVVTISGAGGSGGNSTGKTKLSGDGLTQSFSVHGTYTNAAAYRIDINGVTQEPTVGASVGDYSISSPGTLLFSTAPANGTKIIVIG